MIARSEKTDGIPNCGHFKKGDTQRNGSTGTLLINRTVDI